MLHNSLTIDEKLTATNGRPSGFDYLRFGLAVSVVLVHVIEINYGDQVRRNVWSGPFRPLLGLILPMFFCLSGFLVAGSLERTKTIGAFLYLRIIRIFPALVVEVTLSALIIGGLYTTYTWPAYLTDQQFRHYFLNVIGDIHYTLPGVFLDNPTPGKVNAQLWTIPFELKCYVAAAVLAVFGFHKKRFAFLVMATLAQLVMAQRMLVYGGLDTAIPGNVLVVCFLFGVSFYLYRSVIRLNVVVAILAIFASIILLDLPCGGYFIAIPACYITAYLGLLNPPKAKFLSSGDYSYGIYLYGAPIQQAIAALGAWTHHWALSLMLAGPIIALVAYGSWHCVEKHALNARKLVPKIDAFILLRFTAFRRVRDRAWSRIGEGR